MKIQHVVVHSRFTLEASIQDIQVLRAALHYVYYYQKRNISDEERSRESGLLNTLDDTIRQAGVIERKVRG